MPAIDQPLASEPRRILVRGVNWLGDAVMTTPALERLRQRFPQASISLLTHQKLAELWQRQPSLDAVLPFAAGESPWAIGRRLKREHFDLAVLFPNSPRAALEAFLGRIPQRIGCARPWRNWLLTHPLPPRPNAIRMNKRSPAEIKDLLARAADATAVARASTWRAENARQLRAHHIFDYLHLVSALGANPEPVAPRLHVAAGEMEAIASKFGIRDPENGLFFGLNPGAEYGPAKRWPAERFAAAAREIQHRTGCTWLVFGVEAEMSLANTICATLRNSPAPVCNLAGKTSLRELMALLKLCRVVLTNDSGPMHVAAALGTPVVVPFGSTSAQLTGPGLPGDSRHRLLHAEVACSPCFLRVCPIDFRCMNALSVDMVVDAVLQAMGRSDCH